MFIFPSDASSSETLFNEIKANNNTEHLNAVSTRLQAMDAECNCGEERGSIIAFARNLISKIDPAEILKFYGSKTDPRPDAAKVRVQVSYVQYRFFSVI